MAPWHHHGHPLRMLGVPQLPCGPLATPTIWQRPTPCHGLLIVAYRQDVYRTGGTSSALINLPSTEAGYLQPATTPCVPGIADRVQSQIDTLLLHEMDRAAELQMAAGCGVVHRRTRPCRRPRQACLSVCSSIPGRDLFVAGRYYVKCALFLCCGGQYQPTCGMQATTWGGGWGTPKGHPPCARTLLARRLLCTASRSSVKRHLSLFAATPTDSTAPGRAMAVHEHEPAVGCWEMFPTAVGPARMIPQTDLLGKTTLKARLSWPHLRLPFTRRNVVEEKKETCPRRHL